MDQCWNPGPVNLRCKEHPRKFHLRHMQRNSILCVAACLLHEKHSGGYEMICYMCEEQIHDPDCYEVDANVYVCNQCMEGQKHQLLVHLDSPVSDMLEQAIDDMKCETPVEGWAIDPEH